LSVVLVELGNIDGAESLIAHALGKVDRHARLFLLANQLVCLIERRRFDDAAAVIDRLAEENRSFCALWVGATVTLGRAHCCMAAADYEAARDHVARLECLLDANDQIGGDQSYFELAVAEFYVQTERVDVAALRLRDARRRALMSCIGVMRLDLFLLATLAERDPESVLAPLSELRDWAEAKSASGIASKARDLFRWARARSRHAP
jgi:hypothetical protein